MTPFLSSVIKSTLSGKFSLIAGLKPLKPLKPLHLDSHCFRTRLFGCLVGEARGKACR